MKVKTIALVFAATFPFSAAFAATFDVSSVVKTIDGKCVQNGVVFQPDACKNAYSGESKAPVVKKASTQPKASPVASSRYLDSLPGSTTGSTSLKDSLKIAAQNLMEKHQMGQAGTIRAASKTPEDKAATTSIQNGGVALGSSYAEYKANYDAWKAGLSNTDRIRLSHQQAGYEKYGAYPIRDEAAWNYNKDFERAGKTGWEEMDDAYKARSEARTPIATQQAAVAKPAASKAVVSAAKPMATQKPAIRVASQTPEGKAATTSIQNGGVALGGSYAEYKANYDAWKAGLSNTDRIRLSHQQAGYGAYAIGSEKAWQEKKELEASGKTGWEEMDDAYKSRAR